jgi:hypothetical protein
MSAMSSDLRTDSEAALGDAFDSRAESSVRLTRHDRLQLELKVEHHAPETSSAKLEGELELWFFLPPATGIGAGDYDNERFYEDLRVFTRLKTPTFSLKQLSDTRDTLSPMGRLYSRVIALGDGSLPKRRQRSLRRDCKLLVVATRTALRVDRELEFDDETLGQDPTLQLAEQARNLVRQFRELHTRLQARKLNKRTLRCLSFADEYLSVLVEFAAVEAMVQLQDHRNDQPDAERAFGQLQELAREEVRYRKEREWRSVLDSDPDDPLGKAAYLDQTSLLKKYFSSVLHLTLRQDKTNGWAEHVALAVAAALAMTWAVGLQIVTFFALDLDLSKGMGSGLVLIFFSVAVVGYILKDRIKATVGAALRSRIPQWLSDRRSDIYPNRSEHSIGRVEERMLFVEPDEVPDEVQAARLASLRSRLVAETHVDVLHYRRNIVINCRRARTELDHFEGLSDIIRVNIWRWIRTFAGSKKAVQVLDRSGDPSVVEAPNEYVVDVLVRYSIGSNRAEAEQSSQVQKIRMFLNRRGILRVIAVED